MLRFLRFGFSPNILRCKLVTGEYEPHAKMARGVFDGSVKKEVGSGRRL